MWQFAYCELSPSWKHCKIGAQIVHTRCGCAGSYFFFMLSLATWSGEISILAGLHEWQTLAPHFLQWCLRRLISNTSLQMAHLGVSACRVMASLEADAAGTISPLLLLDVSLSMLSRRMSSDAEYGLLSPDGLIETGSGGFSTLPKWTQVVVGGWRL